MEPSRRGRFIVAGFVALCAALLLLTYAFTTAVTGTDGLTSIGTAVLGVILLVVFFVLYTSGESAPSA